MKQLSICPLPVDEDIFFSVKDEAGKTVISTPFATRDAAEAWVRAQGMTLAREPLGEAR